MRLPAGTRDVLFPFLFFAALAFSLAGCSDDTASKAGKSGAFDHAHDTEVSDIEKHKFEHDFAAQCVDREIKHSVNKTMDRQRFEKPCMCIAKYIMKDLTADEARKFLVHNKNTQSLVIRFDNAAYHCLQQQAQPKAPAIIGKH